MFALTALILTVVWWGPYFGLDPLGLAPVLFLQDASEFRQAHQVQQDRNARIRVCRQRQHRKKRSERQRPQHQRS